MYPNRVISSLMQRKHTCDGENAPMKKIASVVAIVSAFAAGAVVSAQVHDWHDLDNVHKHVLESINEMERARAANHYDMMGHGERAENDLRAAERELGLAVDASKASAR
jgi:hypothetical protein